MTNRVLAWLCAVAAAVMVLVSAGDSQAQGRGRRARACVPGAQSACACPGGASGVQQCNERGTALMACQCPRESAPAASENAEREPSVRARSESARSESAPRLTVSLSSAPVERRWYGWQILIPDLAGSLLSGIGAFVPGAGGSALLITGSTVAFFGGPIVHWAHGHVGRGFASMFGLRLGLPLAGGLVGFGLGSLGGSAGALLGFGLGTSVLALTGIIVDIAALAYDEPATSAAAARAHRPARTWAVAPFGTFDPIRGSAIAGISGVF